MKNTIIRITKTASFLLLATFANPLMAETTTDYNSGWYMGGNVGISTANIDEKKITQNITNPSYSDDESDFGYKLFGGYQFNKYFGLEGGYFNLGKFDYSLSTGTGTAKGSIEVMGVNLDGVALLPITEDFSAFARVGAIYAESKDSFGTTGSISIVDTNPKKSDFNYKFGAGLQYAMTDNLGLRVEAERYRIDDAVGNNGDMDLFSIGLTYRFGVTKKVAPVSKHKEVVAPIQKEKLFLVVTAPKAPEKVEESVTQEKVTALVFENIHFKRNESTLTKEAKDAITRNIAQLDKNLKINVRAVGYTSQSGTEKHNQGLSEKRAQSVKDYLVQEKLVPKDNISVIGYGKTRPAFYEVKPNNVNSKAAQANMRVVLEIINK